MLRYGSNLSVHTQTYTHRHTHTHSNIAQPLKENEMMLFVATWVNLEMIMLSKISLTKKDNHHRVSLLCRIKKNDT